MRLAVGRPVRVGPGDQVIIRGKLPADCKLGRLYVFAREGDAQFSPYVENIGQLLAVSGNKPQLYSPLSMRLDESRQQRELSFTSDIDGWIRVMQEVDRPHDPKAKIRIICKINPKLPWRQKLVRKLSGMMVWIN